MIDNIQIQIPSLPENIRIVESFIDNIKKKSIKVKLNSQIIPIKNLQQYVNNYSLD